MKHFDIALFVMPNSPPREFRFEESRGIREVVVRFRDRAPWKTTVFYLRDKRPRAAWRAQEL